MGGATEPSVLSVCAIAGYLTLGIADVLRGKPAKLTAATGYALLTLETALPQFQTPTVARAAHALLLVSYIVELAEKPNAVDLLAAASHAAIVAAPDNQTVKVAARWGLVAYYTVSAIQELTEGSEAEAYARALLAGTYAAGALGGPAHAPTIE